MTEPRNIVALLTLASMAGALMYAAIVTVGAVL
jgi:hypothetical protein